MLSWVLWQMTSAHTRPAFTSSCDGDSSGQPVIGRSHSRSMAPEVSVEAPMSKIIRPSFPNKDQAIKIWICKDLLRNVHGRWCGKERGERLRGQKKKGLMGHEMKGWRVKGVRGQEAEMAGQEDKSWSWMMDDLTFYWVNVSWRWKIKGVGDPGRRTASSGTLQFQ